MLLARSNSAFRAAASFLLLPLQADRCPFSVSQEFFFCCCCCCFFVVFFFFFFLGGGGGGGGERKEKQLNNQNHGIIYRVSATVTLLTCVTLLDGCFEAESTCSSVTSLTYVALLNGSFESESTGYFVSESV